MKQLGFVFSEKMTSQNEAKWQSIDFYNPPHDRVGSVKKVKPFLVFYNTLDPGALFNPLTGGFSIISISATTTFKQPSGKPRTVSRETCLAVFLRREQNTFVCFIDWEHCIYSALATCKWKPKENGNNSPQTWRLIGSVWMCVRTFKTWAASSELCLS